MRKLAAAASCCLLGPTSLAWNCHTNSVCPTRCYGSRQRRWTLMRRRVSSEDGNSEEDVSSESFELMSARSRLAGQWAAQDEAELPATDARGGAVDAGACVLAALDSGEQRFTVDVDVPFLDRNQPRLYEPPRAAQFAYELALRVATAHRKASSTLLSPPVFVLFATTAEATEAAEAWGPAAVKRGVVTIAVAEEDGRGYKGKAEQPTSSSVDPDALANVKPRLRQAIEDYYASSTTATSSSLSPSAASYSRPSFVVVCPQNGAEMIASRAAIAWADGDEDVTVGGGADCTPGAVVMLNPKFKLPPREMATFQCVFGLVPFKVQAKGAEPSRPDERPSFQPSVVVLKRFGRPWQMFIDGNGEGHVFCGSFGEAATRPQASVLLPTVGAYLQRLVLRNESPSTTTAAEDDGPSAKADEERSLNNNRESNDDDSIETVSYLDRIFALSVDDASTPSSSSLPPTPDDPSTAAEASAGRSSTSEEIAPNADDDVGSSSRRRDKDEETPPSSTSAPSSSSSVEFLNRVFNQPAASSSSDPTENL